MKINITARHLELTAALRNYVEKKLGHINKLTDRITHANIVLNVEKDRHIVEVTINVSRSNINAKATAGDMYAATDMVIDKIVKQLKKHLEKMKDHKDNKSYSMIANLVWKNDELTQEKHVTGEPELEEIKELKIKRQSISEALLYLEKRELNFWIFHEKKEESINIIYKKDDGTYGMLIIRN